MSATKTTKTKAEPNRFVIHLGTEEIHLPPLGDLMGELDAEFGIDAAIEGTDASMARLVMAAFKEYLGDDFSRILREQNVKFGEIQKKLMPWAQWAPEGEEPLGESSGSED